MENVRAYFQLQLLTCLIKTVLDTPEEGVSVPDHVQAFKKQLPVVASLILPVRFIRLYWDRLASHKGDAMPITAVPSLQLGLRSLYFPTASRTPVEAELSNPRDRSWGPAACWCIPRTVDPPGFWLSLNHTNLNELPRLMFFFYKSNCRVGQNKIKVYK